jgi:hypothetical protein
VILVTVIAQMMYWHVLELVQVYDRMMMKLLHAKRLKSVMVDDE